MKQTVVITTMLASALAWPGPVFAEQVLNNFVTELLNISSRAAQDRINASFHNPREGWVFLRSELSRGDHAPVKFSVDLKPGQDGAIVHTGVGPVVQAMRYLTAGRHSVHVEISHPGRIVNLLVRTMPEILYANFPMDPLVTSYPKYNWEFLRRIGLLDNINTIIGSRSGEYEPYLSQWKEQGRRWIVESPVPGIQQGVKVTAEQAYARWAGVRGISNPSLDGLIADEFYPSRRENYQAWVDAIARIENDHAPKTFYPYVAGQPQGLEDFLVPLVQAGTRFAYERYLPERSTEQEAWAFIKDRLVGKMSRFNRVIPGAAEHAIVVLGILSSPPETLNKNPGTNFKVYMDMQFNVLANDPAFVGLYGVMEYLACYADEEYLRWAAKLYRHYCIEGNTRMLSTDPYVLTHIKNPDFEQGADEWDISPASETSVTTGSLKKYGWLVMRYPNDDQGNTFLLMKRHANKPNVAVQQIRNLQPGRYYSVKLISGDKYRMGTRMKHAVSISIDNVDLVERKCFQEVFNNCWSHHAYGFDGSEHKAWFNFFFKVFQARGDTAMMTISDWAGDDEPGGPPDQELMLNFVEIEPYMMD